MALNQNLQINYKMENILHGFKKFMLDYGVVGVMVGFAFAVSTVAFIKSFVSDIFIPFIYYIFGELILKHSSEFMYKHLREIFESSFNIDGFIKEFVTWILILFSTYLIIRYFVQATLLGQNIDDSNKNSQQKQPPSSIKYMQQNDIRLQRELQAQTNVTSESNKPYHNEKFYI